MTLVLQLLNQKISSKLHWENKPNKILKPLEGYPIKVSTNTFTLSEIFLLHSLERLLLSSKNSRPQYDRTKKFRWTKGWGLINDRIIRWVSLSRNLQLRGHYV